MRRGAADLNLLFVFEAVLETRSVSLAAERLGLSQPAVSHALNRLRATLNDQLFVRTPAGMVPTPRAETIAWPVRQSLAGLEAILDPEIFDPAQEESDLEIAVNNYTAIVLAPAIAARCALEAPKVRLIIRPSGTLQLLDLMDRGVLSIVITAPQPPTERFRAREVMADDYVVVMQSGGPLDHRRLDIEALAAVPHLGISSSIDDAPVDAAFGSAGLRRHIVLQAPFLSAGEILSQSRMVAVLPRNIATSLCRTHQLEMLEIPFVDAPVVTSMIWPRRLDENKAHRWIREIVIEQAARLTPASRLKAND